MNTIDNFLDPFGDAPVTVGMTNYTSNAPVMAQAMPAAGKTKVAPEFQYAQMMEHDHSVAKKDELIYC